MEVYKGVKAIEVPYKGYRMRSLTEARWAIFFDTFRLRWYHEYEGIKGIPYVPDFYVKFPFGWAWVEVKPADWEVTDEDWQKIRDFQAAIGDRSIHVVSGPPHEEIYEQIWSVDIEARMVFSGFFESDRDLFRTALANARGARFDHGENGTQHIGKHFYVEPHFRPIKQPPPIEIKPLEEMRWDFLWMNLAVHLLGEAKAGEGARGAVVMSTSRKYRIRCPWGDEHPNGDPYGAYIRGPVPGIDYEFTFCCAHDICRKERKRNWDVFVDEIVMPAVCVRLRAANASPPTFKEITSAEQARAA